MQRNAPHKSRNMVFFRVDPELEKLRKSRDWADFHRLCGAQRLYFDDIEKVSRKEWCADAFTIKTSDIASQQIFLAKGSGETVMDAIRDAFEKSRIWVEGAFELIAKIKNAPESIGIISHKTAENTAKSTPESITSETDIEDLIG